MKAIDVWCGHAACANGQRCTGPEAPAAERRGPLISRGDRAYTTQARRAVLYYLSRHPGANAARVHYTVGPETPDDASTRAVLRRARRAGLIESCESTTGRGVGLRLTEAGLAVLRKGAL